MKTDNTELFEHMPVSKAVITLIIPTVISVNNKKESYCFFTLYTVDFEQCNIATIRLTEYPNPR